MDWKTLPFTANHARNALTTLTGDPEALAFIEQTLTHLENENQTRSHTRRTGKHRTVRVAGGAYSREQPLIRVRWTCIICGSTHEREQLPGNTPKYCPPLPGEKQSDCQREASRQRVRAFREKQRQQEGESTPSLNEQTESEIIYAESITHTPVTQPIAEDVPSPPSKFRIKPAHLQLLKKAANATLANPAYVTRDTAHYSQLLELADAGLVETFSRGNSSRRVYFQLTDAGLEASKKHFREL